MAKTLEQRFEQKVKRGRGGHCDLWIGAVSSGSIGYGTLKKNGRTHYAHRVAYELHNGTELSSNVCVLHTCDTPHCVSGHHLAIGSRAANNADRTVKFRSYTKLTGAEVIRIISFREQGRKATQLAEQFGVSTSTIYSICRGNTWGWLTGLGKPLAPVTTRPIRSPRRRKRVTEVFAAVV